MGMAMGQVRMTQQAVAPNPAGSGTAQRLAEWGVWEPTAHSRL